MGYNKKWTQENKEVIKLKRKRSDCKEKLIKYDLLPETYPYTKIHEELMDKLKSNQFDELNILIANTKKEIKIKKVKAVRKYIPVDKNANKIRKRLAKVILAGLIPEDYQNLKTEQQREIYDLAVNNLDFNINDIIKLYINDTNLKTKQRYLYDKLKIKINQPIYKDKGKHVNIKPEDIIVNEYCPFLNLKIDYRTSPQNTFLNNSHSFDRIVNSKGYVTGNVWVISRLANTMKNEATDEQLKTFCKNIILMYAGKTNRRI
jgi:hypothetical protein